MSEPPNIIMKFKKGGRIAEERVYNSGDEDPESLSAVSYVLSLIGDEIGPAMIGKGFWGYLPWELHLITANPIPEQVLTVSTPVRVADVLLNRIALSISQWRHRDEPKP